MAIHSMRAALAALFACASMLPAGAQTQLCSTANGRTAFGFQVNPALVFNDAALEGAFDFTKAIDSLTRSADPIAWEAMDETGRTGAKRALLQSMIDTFDNDGGFMINRPPYVLVPSDDRFVDGKMEGRLDPAKLLDKSDPEQGMKPLAVFNRFDLAPKDWAHCGEYRIIYAIPNGGFQKRFLLIFEAGLPNPSPAAGAAGCRPVAEFWARLAERGAAPDIAAALADFYFSGIDGVSPRDQNGSLVPVIDYRNLGGDGVRGQVRANMFFEGGWQLREWLVQPVAAGLAFVPETVKNNPIVELYRDDLAGTRLAELNRPEALAAYHADFLAHFANDLHPKLTTENSQLYRDLVSGLLKFDVPEVSDGSLLVTLVGLGSDDLYNEFQSVSDPTEADLPQPGSGLIARLAQTIPAPVPGAEGEVPQPIDIIIARAEASSCSGCHQTSPRNGTQFSPSVVKRVPGQPDVLWPDVVPLGAGFVHVHENRTLSPALVDHFLPVRRYILGRYLCELPAGPAAFSTAAASGRGQYYGEALLAASARSMGAAMPLATPATLPSLPFQDRVIAASALAAEIDARRSAEERTPGAFIEVRRPH